MDSVEDRKFTAEEVEEATKTVKFSDFQKAIDIIEKGAIEDIQKDVQEENER